MLLAKTAILLEWKSLFVPGKQRNWFFWATTTMIGINVAAYSVAIIMTCLRCKPIWKIWQPEVEGSCKGLSEQKSTDVATTFVNLVLDLLILLLPQPIIWKLNQTRQRKIGVSFIFSIGLLCVSFLPASQPSYLYSVANLTYEGSLCVPLAGSSPTYHLTTKAIRPAAVQSTSYGHMARAPL